MSSLLNREQPKEKRPRRVDEQGRELIKNQECVGCKKMFDCKGKPRNVTACVNFEERTRN